MVTLVLFVLVLVVLSCKSPAWVMAQAKKPAPHLTGMDVFVRVCLYTAGVVVLYGILLHNTCDFIPWTRSVSVERVSAPHAAEPTEVQTAWR